MLIEKELGAEWHHLEGAFGKGCQVPEDVTACRTLSQKGGVE